MEILGLDDRLCNLWIVCLVNYDRLLIELGHNMIALLRPPFTLNRIKIDQEVLLHNLAVHS